MFIKRLHPGLFGISLGLISLSGTWRKFSQLDMTPNLNIENLLFTGGVTILTSLTLLFLIKLIVDTKNFKNSFYHPVQGSLFALMPVSTLLAIALYAPKHQEQPNLIIAVTVIALIFQFITAWKMVEMLSSGKMPAELITPALYVPVVPGGLVGGMALNAIGFSGFGYLLWGMGVGAWALLEMRILSHLFKGPLPEPIRATIGIEMAPAAVSTLTAIALWPSIPVDAVLIGLGIASGPILAVLTRWKAWTSIPFSFGFWSFSFPVAATASCIIEAVQRGSWPKEVALISISLATLIIGYLALRTSIQLIQGNLLPKAS
jgi:tellurite resistance protein